MDYFYLDLGPMIRRLRQHPSEFYLRYDSVHHRMSGCRLTRIRNRTNRLVACCNGVEFPIVPDQSSILAAALANWEEVYWRPLVARKNSGRRLTSISSGLAVRCGPNTRWRQRIGAMCAWFSIRGWQQHRRVSRPNFHVISSLSGDTGPPAVARACTAIERGVQDGHKT